MILRTLTPLSLIVVVGLAAVPDRQGTREATRATHPPAHVQVARPAQYTVKRPFVSVRTSQQLQAALRRRTPAKIVLEPGRYDSDRPFVDANGHAIYAAMVGKAVLTAGVQIAGGAGLVRGVVFDVSEPAKTVEGAAVRVTGSGAAVLDLVLRGHGALRSGVAVTEPEGFRAARIVVRGFTDYGVLVDASDPNRTSLRRSPRLRDLDIAGVSRSTPGSSRGTAEACIWIGNPATVVDVRARRCAWTGLWTGTAATGTHFDRVEVDDTPTGVYLEHFTHRSTFNRLRVGPSVRVGLTAEWADPSWGSEPASVDNVIDHSWFATSLAGVYLDKGTTRTTIRRTTFVGQQWAAIGDYFGVGNRYYENDYSAVAPSGAAVTHAHIPS
jgi:hypothetical protein